MTTANPLDPSAEVWEPERLVALLVPGARVRVRVSGECGVGHLPWESGKAGVVTGIHPKPSYGHRFWVRHEGTYSWSSCAYAAIELEPLEPSGP